jgi:RNase adaptor protein for sRNA GlmZ degradation
LIISLHSFGFKYGHQVADFLWDVRFLPNPYWVPELKPYSGRHAEVAAYVLANETGSRFLSLVEPLLVFLLEEHAARGREAVGLAVGCTGGRHRSVAVVEHLGRSLVNRDLSPRIHHRDINKE